MSQCIVAFHFDTHIGFYGLNKFKEFVCPICLEVIQAGNSVTCINCNIFVHQYSCVIYEGMLFPGMVEAICYNCVESL